MFKAVCSRMLCPADNAASAALARTPWRPCSSKCGTWDAHTLATVPMSAAVKGVEHLSIVLPQPYPGQIR